MACLTPRGTTLVPRQVILCNKDDQGLAFMVRVHMAWGRLLFEYAGKLGSASSAVAANVTYFIQAERVLHDFAPGGTVDQCTGLPLEGELSVRASPLTPPHTRLPVHRCEPHPPVTVLPELAMLHVRGRPG